MQRRSVGEDTPSSLSPVLAEEIQRGDDCIESLQEELVRILDAEIEQYRELLRMLRSQRECFNTREVKSFEEINKQQGTIVLKIKTLEEARKFIASRLAQCFDIPGEEVTLAKLASLADKPYGERCKAYQKEIVSLIRELESLKESNAYLIQQSLHYISGVLKIFASAHDMDIAYSDNGNLNYKAKKGKHVSGWG